MTLNSSDLLKNVFSKPLIILFCLKCNTLSQEDTFQSVFLKIIFQTYLLVCSPLHYFFRPNMDAIFSGEHENPSPFKPPTGDNNKGDSKHHERKLQFRYLTDKILEKYRRMSEDSDLWQRQYEEAAFKVYGTLPTKKLTSFRGALKKN